MKTQLIFSLVLFSGIAVSQEVEHFVTFQVDMSDLINSKSFEPQNNKLQVKGSLTPLVWDGLDTTTNVLGPQSPDTSNRIFILTLKFKYVPGSEILFKYRITNYNLLVDDPYGLNSTLGWEGGDNRSVILYDGDTVLALTKTRHLGLGIPNLILPPNNSLNVDTTLTLKWNSLSLLGTGVHPDFSYNFRIQTAEDSLFFMYKKDYYKSSCSYDTCVTFDIFGLKKGTIYYWRVARFAYDSSLSNLKFSDFSSFMTKIGKPQFSLTPGIYNTKQNLTISTTNNILKIYYTRNGSEPTTASILYTLPVQIDSTQTIKARCFLNDSIFGETASAAYTLKCPTPIFSPVAGSFSAPQNVTITSLSDSATIYYTLDGIEPTESSVLYVSPILIDTNKTLKAKAFKKGWVVSDTRTGNYTIASQVFTVNFNTPSIWFDANFDGKESKTITPTVTISYGNIVAYEWAVGNNVIGTTNSVNAELPTGTWYAVLSMTSDRGIVKKDSVKISVYAAEATTTGSIESAVSQLSENIYFVTSKGGSVYRFDTTGVIAWTIQTGGSIQSTTCVSSQENIYVGSNDTRLYSFDYHGIPRWDKAMGGTIVSSPSSVFDSLIYVGISTGRLFALDEAGNIKWSVQTGGPVNSSASINENGNAYVGSNDAQLYAISPVGTVLWNYATGGAIRTSPGLGLDSSIVFGSDDGFLYKVDWNGNLKWKYQTGGQIKSSPVIGLDGIIYFGSGDGKVYSLSKAGDKLWEFNAGSAVNVTPALSTDGSIYFGALNGTIYALDQSGIQKWMLQTGKPILAPMLVTSSKMIMVGDTLGKVYIMKIPTDSLIANLSSEFVASTKTVSISSYEWWTFKGNNQRTGYRKNITTGAKNLTNIIPGKFALRQNYPNPFNPTTIIEYDLPKTSRVKIHVFDMLGRQVTTLVDEQKSGGSYKVEFNTIGLSSGVYFYHLQTNEFTQTKKLVLIR